MLQWSKEIPAFEQNFQYLVLEVQPLVLRLQCFPLVLALCNREREWSGDGTSSLGNMYAEGKN